LLTGSQDHKYLRAQAIVRKLDGVTVATTIIIFGSIGFMGWNIDHVTKHMWHCVQPSDKVLAMELAIAVSRSNEPQTTAPACSNLTPSCSMSDAPSGSSPAIISNHNQSSIHDSEAVGSDLRPGSSDHGQVKSAKAHGKRRAISPMEDTGGHSNEPPTPTPAYSAFCLTSAMVHLSSPVITVATSTQGLEKHLSMSNLRMGTVINLETTAGMPSDSTAVSSPNDVHGASTTP
jgi:hypothetical protein